MNTSKVMREELQSRAGNGGRDVLIAALPPKLSHSQNQFHQLSRLGIESFRFEEQNEYEYDIYLKVFARVLKNKTVWKSFILLFFRQKR